MADIPEDDISKINVFNALKEQKEMEIKGNLYHNTQILFAYNTSCMEGNKLTEEQTRHIFETNTILFDKITVANVDDILEILHHFKLVDYMLSVANEELTEESYEKLVKIYKKLL